MTDYSKGQIYKVVDVGMTKCYIGSKVQKLFKIMAQHRKDYKQYLNEKRHYYNSIFKLFDEFGIENCKIVWVKHFPCNTKEELEAEEGRLQKETDCVNKSVAGRTKKEYYEDNKEAITEQNKQKYQINKEKMLERKKQDYQKHRESRLMKAKDSRDNRKEVRKEYDRQRYLKKKQQLQNNPRE